MQWTLFIAYYLRGLFDALSYMESPPVAIWINLLMFLGNWKALKTHPFTIYDPYDLTLCIPLFRITSKFESHHTSSNWQVMQVGHFQLRTFL